MTSDVRFADVVGLLVERVAGRGEWVRPTLVSLVTTSIHCDSPLDPVAVGGDEEPDAGPLELEPWVVGAVVGDASWLLLSQLLRQMDVERVRPRVTGPEWEGLGLERSEAVDVGGRAESGEAVAVTFDEPTREEPRKAPGMLVSDEPTSAAPAKVHRTKVPGTFDEAGMLDEVAHDADVEARSGVTSDRFDERTRVARLKVDPPKDPPKEPTTFEGERVGAARFSDPRGTPNSPAARAQTAGPPDEGLKIRSAPSIRGERVPGTFDEAGIPDEVAHDADVEARSGVTSDRFDERTRVARLKVDPPKDPPKEPITFEGERVGAARFSDPRGTPNSPAARAQTAGPPDEGLKIRSAPSIRGERVPGTFDEAGTLDEVAHDADVEARSGVTSDRFDERTRVARLKVDPPKEPITFEGERVGAARFSDPRGTPNSPAARAQTAGPPDEGLKIRSAPSIRGERVPGTFDEAGIPDEVAHDADMEARSGVTSDRFDERTRVARLKVDPPKDPPKEPITFEGERVGAARFSDPRGTPNSPAARAQTAGPPDEGLKIRSAPSIRGERVPGTFDEAGIPDEVAHDADMEARSGVTSDRFDERTRVAPLKVDPPKEPTTFEGERVGAARFSDPRGTPNSPAARAQTAGPPDEGLKIRSAPSIRGERVPGTFDEARTLDEVAHDADVVARSSAPSDRFDERTRVAPLKEHPPKEPTTFEGERVGAARFSDPRGTPNSPAARAQTAGPPDEGLKIRSAPSIRGERVPGTFDEAGIPDEATSAEPRKAPSVFVSDEPTSAAPAKVHRTKVPGTFDEAGIPDEVAHDADVEARSGVTSDRFDERTRVARLKVDPPKEPITFEGERVGAARFSDPRGTPNSPAARAQTAGPPDEGLKIRSAPSIRGERVPGTFDEAGIPDEATSVEPRKVPSVFVSDEPTSAAPAKVHRTNKVPGTFDEARTLDEVAHDTDVEARSGVTSDRLDAPMLPAAQALSLDDAPRVYPRVEAEPLKAQAFNVQQLAKVQQSSKVSGTFEGPTTAKVPSTFDEATSAEPRKAPSVFASDEPTSAAPAKVHRTKVPGTFDEARTLDEVAHDADVVARSGVTSDRFDERTRVAPLKEHPPKEPTTFEGERVGAARFSDTRGTPNSPAARAQTAGPPDEGLKIRSAPSIPGERVPGTFDEAGIPDEATSAEPRKAPSVFASDEPTSAAPAKVHRTKVPGTFDEARTLDEVAHDADVVARSGVTSDRLDERTRVAPLKEHPPKEPTTFEGERVGAARFSDPRGTPNSPAARAQTAGPPDEGLKIRSAPSIRGERVPGTFDEAGIPDEATSAEPRKAPSVFVSDEPTSAAPAKVHRTKVPGTFDEAGIPDEVAHDADVEARSGVTSDRFDERTRVARLKVDPPKEPITFEGERVGAARFSDPRGTPNSPAARAQTAGPPDEGLKIRSAPSIRGERVPGTFDEAGIPDEATSVEPRKVPSVFVSDEPTSAAPAKVHRTNKVPGTFDEARTLDEVAHDTDVEARSGVTSDRLDAPMLPAAQALSLDDAPRVYPRVEAEPLKAQAFAIPPPPRTTRTSHLESNPPLRPPLPASLSRSHAGTSVTIPLAGRLDSLESGPKLRPAAIVPRAADTPPVPTRQTPREPSHHSLHHPTQRVPVVRVVIRKVEVYVDPPAVAQSPAPSSLPPPNVDSPFVQYTRHRKETEP